jgi:hypothetical protein
MGKKNEAMRRQHLLPEIINWSIQKRARKLASGMRVAGGMVLCENRHGGQWVMSAADFDSFYKTR